MALIPGIQDIQGLSKWLVKNLPVLVFIVAVGFYHNYQHGQLPYHSGMPGYVRTQVEISSLQIQRNRLVREIGLMELSITHNPGPYVEINRMILLDKKTQLEKVKEQLIFLENKDE